MEKKEAKWKEKIKKRGKREGEWKGDRARGNWKVKGTEQKKTGKESGKFLYLSL